MSNLLFQTIDQISREKGIDPQIVIHAIEDAIVVASRKYFKSNEELRGRINPETGEIDVFAIRKVVDRSHESRARNLPRRSSHDQTRRAAGRRNRIPETDRRPGPHRRADGQAGHFSESSRSRARKRLRRIPQARRRSRQLRRQAVRERRHHRRTRQDRRQAAEARSVEARKFLRRRSHSRHHHQSRKDLEGTAGRSCRARIPHWFSICSKPKCRKSTTAPFRSRASRAKPANERRLPLRRAKRMSIRSAPASA